MSGQPDSLPEAMNAAVAAVVEVGGWIKHADAKCGFLIAADMVLIGSIAGLGGRINLPLGISDGLILAATGSVLLSIVFCMMALWPRTGHVARTLFDWPVLAGKREPLAVPLSSRATIEDLWSHALTLAQINRAKYQALNGAMVSALVGIACTIAWSITLAPIT